jgi:hypothetical protein
MGGRQETVSATVASMHYVYYRRSLCVQRVQLEITGRDNCEICLRTVVTSPLTTARIGPGASVRIHLVDTIFGRVVESIEPER